MFGSLRDYLGKKRSELLAGLAVAAAVLVVYSVVSLIAFNSLNISYALTFALAAFLIYFIIQRLLRYLVTKREGVIEKRK